MRGTTKGQLGGRKGNGRCTGGRVISANAAAVFIFTRRCEGQRGECNVILQHERSQVKGSRLCSQSRDGDESVRTRPARRLS